MTKPDKDTCQFKLRLPKPLKDWIQGHANTERRSLSAEITVRLEESRARQGRIQTNRPTLE